MEIILASQSPRRKELLTQMGIRNFIVCPACGDEVMDKSMPPQEIVKALSAQKAQQVQAVSGQDALIIASDTIVVCQNEILGKPTDEKQAQDMLTLLSGRTHSVYTGIAVVRGDKCLLDSTKTDVRFRPLGDTEIKAYIKTGEPMDKAGAYGIQGYASVFIEEIFGDYYSVMGLPICKLGGMLSQFGVEPFSYIT